MAEFVARIKPRRSSTSGETPNPSDLTVAELAVNTADGILFTKHTDGTIKAISGSGGGSGGGSAASIEGIGNVLPRLASRTDILSWDSKGDTATTGGWLWTAATQSLVLNKESKDGTDIRLELVGLPATGTLFYSLAGGTEQSVYEQVPYLDLAISGETITLTLLVDGGGGEARGLAERIWTSRNVDLADEIWISFEESTDELIESKTNDFLIYDASISKWVVKEGGTFNLSDTPDTPGAALNEQALVWDNTDQNFKFGFPLLSEDDGNAISGKAENRLLGPGAYFASTAAAEAAGWINTSIAADDSIGTFAVPAAHVGKFFLGQAMPANLNVNTNGALSFDFEGRASNKRDTDFVNNATDAGSNPIQFYLSLMAQDVATNNVYYKTITDGWVVRCEWKIPYNVSSGVVTEVTFYDYGKIRVSYGAAANGSMTISNTAQGIRLGRDDNNIVQGWDSYTQKDSPYSLVIQPSFKSGRVLSDLADVNQAINERTQGATLLWDENREQYIPKVLTYSDLPGAPPASSVLSVNGETGDVSLGIQDMDDFELNRQASTGVGGVRVKVAAANTTDNSNGFSQENENFIVDHVDAAGLDEYQNGGWVSQIAQGVQIVVVDSQGNQSTTSVVNNPTVDTISQYGPRTYFAVDSTFQAAMEALPDGEEVTIGLSELYTPETIALTEGDILQWNNADQKFKPAQPFTPRVQDQVVTGVLETNASASVSANIGKSGTFVSIETDQAAWVVFYATEAARTLDASRGENVAPQRGSGVLLEVLTAGNETILVTPTVGFFNAEQPLASQIPMRIVNKGSSGAVTVTVAAIRLEP